MSDAELIERLRDPPFADRIHTVSLHNEAADRLLALSTQCEGLRKQAARNILEWGQHKPNCNARRGTLCDCRFTIVEANARTALSQHTEKGDAK